MAVCRGAFKGPQSSFCSVSLAYCSQVLKRYSDKTVAQNLVLELESYGGDPSNLVLSQGTLMQSPDSESSGSTTSHDIPFESIQSLKPPPSHSRPPEYTHDNAGTTSEDESSTDEETGDDEVHNLRTFGSHVEPYRPHSSASARHYRTPTANSLLSQTPMGGSNIPATQPLPAFETPSAFPAPAPSTPGSMYNIPARPNIEPMHLGHRPHSQPLLRPISAGHNHSPARPASRLTLERAVEHVQAHLAALTERLAVLESRSIHNSALSSHNGSPRRTSYSYEGGLAGSGRLSRRATWDLNDLGMWSYILKPLYRALSFLYKSAHFFASDESRSPTKMIVRRLCLDISFLLCVIAILGAFWRKSGMRRREVKVALVVLGRAMAGSRVPGGLSERGV